MPFEHHILIQILIICKSETPSLDIHGYNKTRKLHRLYQLKIAIKILFKNKNLFQVQEFQATSVNFDNSHCQKQAKIQYKTIYVLH